MAKKRKPQEYEQLGRMLENIYESGYIDRNQAYKTSFIKGLVSGLGGVLGATILIALLLWILTLFKQVPLVGPFLEKVRTTVQSERR
jgi:hypothetical protein